MADLPSKVKNALDEARILVLGGQVLLGFQYRGFFEPLFDKLPPLQMQVKHLGLFLLLAVLGLVMLPAARHRIVEQGQDTKGLLRFTKWCLRLALLPLALAIGIDLFTAGAQVGGTRVGAAIAGGAVLLSVALWYGTVVLREPREKEEADVQETSLEQKIAHVLVETRVVLPGAQALLGFQLAMMMTEAFEKLPQSSKVAHLVSLCLIAATTILLIAPAAFHRLVEQGEDTERFHRFASAMILLAMGTLAPGFCLDLYVVTKKLTASTSTSLWTAGAALACFYGAWFGLTLLLRASKRKAA